MFESQSAASSPEPRGRSPAGRINTDGVRPTSKVRASFVSVEPSGHITRDLGATKGTVEGINSPQAHRRESFSVSDELGEDTVTELKKVVSHEKEARKHSADVVETIPEQAVETRESSRAPPPIRETEGTMPNLGSIMKGSDFPEPHEAEKEKPKAEQLVQAKAEQADTEKIEDTLAKLSLQEVPADNPDKAVTGAQEEASLKPADPKDEVTVSGGGALPPPTEVLPSANTAKAASATPKAERSMPSKAKVNGTSTTPAATKKPAAISTAKASASKASSAKSPLPKSPGIARLPKTPTTSKATPSASAAKSPALNKEQPKPAATKEPAKAPVSKASRASLRPSTASTTASTAAKAKVPVVENKKPTTKPTTTAPADAPKDNITTSPGGFKKPRPKSPTRPVRLPSHLTAPTASSAAKHGEESTQKLARKPSTVSRPSLPKATPAARKQPSRASLAPSTTSTKRPESRTSTRGAADEGFLARMMRPTASSASKTLDRPISPPRRGPSVRAPAKPKTGPESAVAKGKKKVGEIASKAKEAVTNGHSEDNTSEVSPTNGTAAEASEPAPPADTEREATPAEQVESSAVELQTPNFEGQAIR